MRSTKHPLDQDNMTSLRELIAQLGARRLSETLDVDPGALARAAAGERLLRGTRALITAGLDRMRAAGEAPRS